MAPSSGLFEKAQHRFKVVLRHICAALFTSGSLKIKIALKKYKLHVNVQIKMRKTIKINLKIPTFRYFCYRPLKTLRKHFL